MNDAVDRMYVRDEHISYLIVAVTLYGEQRLGDIRDLCAHGAERDPTRIEIDEMINGVEKVIKSIF